MTLDCAIEMTAASTVTWDLDTGFTTDPWNAQEVKVRFGDYYLGAFTATSASVITLDDAVTGIQAGFDYETRVEPMPPDIQLGDGPMTGERRRITAVNLHLYETLNCILNGKEINPLVAGFDVGSPPTRMAGKYHRYLRGWGRDPTIVITQTAPMPMEILGMNMEVSI